MKAYLLAEKYLASRVRWLAWIRGEKWNAKHDDELQECLALMVKYHPAVEGEPDENTITNARLARIKYLQGKRICGYENRRYIDALDLPPARKPNRCPDCVRGEFTRRGEVLCERCYSRAVREEAHCYPTLSPELLPCRAENDEKVWTVIEGIRDDVLRTIAEGIAGGKSRAETARELGISVRSVFLKIKELRRVLVPYDCLKEAIS